MSIRPWAVWRRTLYSTVFFLLLAGGVTTWYATQVYEAPTCFDNLHNGTETGVDCGGGCTRICAADIIPPEIVWAQSFEIADGQYNAVAYINNRNQTAGTPQLSYTFELLSDGDVVASRGGSTLLAPNTTYPLFEGRIAVPSDVTVTDTRLTIDPSPTWLPATVAYNQFRSLDIDLVGADIRPRLNVEMENTALTNADNVEVVATIFNAAGQPVTTSQTVIESIAGRSTKDIVFTWPRPIAKTVKSCIIPTDVVLAIDVSGSMNNDSTEPPQPLTDALRAASTFVNDLDTNDQVALVTFATDAQVRQTLSNNHAEAATIISALTIEPKEETGFTNTRAALEAATTLVSDASHNENARRVIVLLTDGLPTSNSSEDVITPTIDVARAADSDGVEIYSIGLGQSVDRSFITAIASTPDTAYFAPSSADLAQIYSAITSSLCEAGPARIDVIAKPIVNFAQTE